MLLNKLRIYKKMINYSFNVEKFIKWGIIWPISTNIYEYDNEYASIIDIYFYEFFQSFQTSSACAPKHLRHPVCHFGKCLR